MGIKYLDDLLIGYKVIIDGADVEATRQSKVKFAGSVVTNDPATGITTVTVSGTGVDLAGDLGNTVATPWVTGLYGNPLDAASFGAPDSGACAQFDGTKWVASTSLALVAAATVTLSGLGATAGAPGVKLSNTTASLAVGDQYSPAQVFSFQAWDGAATIAIDLALQGAQNVDGSVYLRLYQQLAGGGYSASISLGTTLSWPEDAGPKLAQDTKTAAGNASRFSISAQAPQNTGAGGNGAGGIFTASSGTGTDHDGGDWTFKLGNKSVGAGRAGELQVLNSSSASVFIVAHDGTITTSLGSGLVHASVGGVLSSSALVNADVDAAAAIAGSKITPTFGAQTISTSAGLNVTGGTGIGLGTTPASTGALRFSDSGSAYVWDSVGSTDRRVWDFNVALSNGHTFGDAAVPAQLLGSALTASDGTRSYPIIPSIDTATTTTDATPTALASIAITDNTCGQVEVEITGRDTTNHKLFRHRAVIDYKKVSGALTLLETATQKNTTTGVSPAYDGIGVAADVSYSGASGNLVPTFTGKVATTIPVTREAWVRATGAI